MRTTQTRCGIGLAMAIAVVAATSCGQSHRSATPATSARPATRPDVYAAGDLLQIRLGGLSSGPHEMTATARVQGDGTITVPLMPDVTVAGMDRAAFTRLLDRVFFPCFGPRLAIDVSRLQVADGGGPMPGPIGPFDLVRCVVFGLGVEPGIPTVVVQRVSADGTIVPPLCGPVRVAGLTDPAAARAVEAAYKAGNVLSAAQVSVLTLERAPADAGHRPLPDGPILPVPTELRDLYLPR